MADKHAEKLATPDIALALWNIASTVGNNEHLRASALAVLHHFRIHLEFFIFPFQALCHLGLSYPDVLQSVIDKVTIKGDIFQSTSSKVLQYHITLLSILAKRTKNRSMFMQVRKSKTRRDRLSAVHVFLPGNLTEDQCALREHQHPHSC